MNLNKVYSGGDITSGPMKAFVEPEIESFADKSGCTVTKRFDKVETSKRGKLLYNAIESAITGMGQAVSEQEKRQILMDVLRELC